MWPPLTTIRTPRVEIGKKAASMLLQLMKSETLASNSLDMGWTLIQRQST
jgi:LacI family gluconate utilization system Gnt-I transcriptional repressor